MVPLLTTKKMFLKGIVEELLFRKYILSLNLEFSKNKVFSIGVTSFLFGFIHLPSITSFVVAFIAGIIYSIVYLKTGKIIFVITLHFFNNLIAIVLRTIFPSEYQEILRILSFSIYYWLLFFLSGILLFILIYNFKKNLLKT